jgi:hypothetical protein
MSWCGLSDCCSIPDRDCTKIGSRTYLVSYERSSRGKVSQSMKLTTQYLHLVLIFRMHRALPPYTVWVFKVWCLGTWAMLPFVLFRGEITKMCLLASSSLSVYTTWDLVSIIPLNLIFGILLKSINIFYFWIKSDVNRHFTLFILQSCYMKTTFISAFTFSKTR